MCEGCVVQCCPGWDALAVPSHNFAHIRDLQHLDLRWCWASPEGLWQEGEIASFLLHSSRATNCFEKGAQLIPPEITRENPKLGQPTRATLELGGGLRQSLVCITRSRWQTNEGSPVCAAPPRILHCPSLESPAQCSYWGGGCTITPLPASSSFLLSVRHNTESLGCTGQEATTGAVSNVPFQQVTEHSDCLHTRSFLSTQRTGNTPWENDSCPAKDCPERTGGFQVSFQENPRH